MLCLHHEFRHNLALLGVCIFHRTVRHDLQCTTNKRAKDRRPIITQWKFLNFTNVLQSYTCKQAVQNRWCLLLTKFKICPKFSILFLKCRLQNITPCKNSFLFAKETSILDFLLFLHPSLCLADDILPCTVLVSSRPLNIDYAAHYASTCLHI